MVGAPHDRSGDTSSSAGRRAIVANRHDPKVIEEQLRILGGRTDTEEQAAVRDATIAKMVQETLQRSDEEGRINQGMPFPEATTNEALGRELSAINVPVLILAGMRDGVISPQASLRAAVSVPRAKAVFYEEEGHFVAQEHPERLVQDITVFLHELGRDPAAVR